MRQLASLLYYLDLLLFSAIARLLYIPTLSPLSKSIYTASQSPSNDTACSTLPRNQPLLTDFRSFIKQYLYYFSMTS